MVDDDYPMNVIGDQTNLTLKYSQSRRLTLSGMTSWDTTSGNTQFFTAF